MFNITRSEPDPEQELNLTDGKSAQEDFLLKATYFLMFQIGK